MSILQSQDGSTAWLSSGAIVHDAAPVVKKPTSSYLKTDYHNNKWAFWGSDDNRPRMIMDKVEKNVVASSGLEWLVKAFFGQGIITYKVREENGKEIILPYKDPEIEDFFERNDIFAYTEEALWDYVYFKSLFPEMYLGRGRYSDKIVKLQHLEADSCRWGVMSEKSRRIEKLYYSYQFPNASEGDYETTPVFDPRDPGKNNKFVWRPRFASIGRRYYPKTPWHSIIDSGWMDISNNIPGYKAHLFKQQMGSIRYIIKIPADYWSGKYKGYDKMTLDDQKGIREKELTEFNDFLSNPDNDRIAFITHFAIDRRTGKELPGWVIEPVDNKFKSEYLIPDGLDADQRILFALNIDPTLKGASLNSKLTSEGGSNKREAFSIFNSTLHFDRQRFLQPLYFIQKYNGWDKDVRFGFKNIELTTLDKNPTGTQTTAS